MPPTSVRNEARSTPWPAGRKAGGLSSNLSLYFPLGLLLVPPFGQTLKEARIQGNPYSLTPNDAEQSAGWRMDLQRPFYRLCKFHNRMLFCFENIKVSHWKYPLATCFFFPTHILFSRFIYVDTGSFISVHFLCCLEFHHIKIPLNSLVSTSLSAGI